MRPRAFAVLFAALFACARSSPPPRTLPTSPESSPPAAQRGDSGAEPAGDPVGPPAGPAAGDTDAGADAPEQQVPSEPAAGADRPQPFPPAPRSLPGRLRVGLETDLPSVTIPCCSPRLVVRAGGREVAVAQSLTIEPGVHVDRPPLYRLQVAALRDERQASALASRYGAMLKVPSRVVFDAGDGLYRVRLGEYASRDAADRDLGRLAQHNLHDAWVVGEQPSLENPAVKITQGSNQWLARGRWVVIGVSPSEGADGAGGGGKAGEGLAYGGSGGKRYRGQLLLYLNDRGLLNVINRVSVDNYLRGVVPREMGPALYDDVEALKAQAVAARTYTLRNLGEFRAEGYDICATPRCQVYGGIGSEHPLSDRAVAETSGIVLLHDGRFADTLYTSTCGGHTEDVEVIFPLKRHPYLRGVPCLEGGVDGIGRSKQGPGSLPATVLEQVLPSEAATGLDRSTPAGFGRAALRLASMAGVASGAGGARAPGSLARRDVSSFLATLLEVHDEAGLFVSDEDVRYLVPAAEQWQPAEARAAAYLVQEGVLEAMEAGETAHGPPGLALDAAEADRTLFRLALYLRLVERTDVRYSMVEDGRLVARDGAAERIWELPEAVATFSSPERMGDGASVRRTRRGPLALVPGDRLSVYSVRVTGGPSRLLALRQHVDPGGVAFDRGGKFRSWRRFRSDRELRKLVEERYPGLGFRTLQIVSRGGSGRVGVMRLVGENGKSVDVVGLPVRWTLDVPETLFTVRRLQPEGGEAGWLFSGRGWGHGVGMCQVGAFGMALRGHGYKEILSHYYSGLELRRLPIDSRPVSAP